MTGQVQGASLLSSAALRPLERALNRSIAASSAATHALRALSGKAVRIEVTGWPAPLRLRVRDATIELETGGAEACAATISGTPLALARLAFATTAAATRVSRARLDGDLEIVEQLADVLRLARPAPLLLLANWIGDVPAYELGRVLKASLDWHRDATRSFERSLAEYLQEEARQVPAPLEAEALFQDIEQLRDDVERAGRRLDLLAARHR